MKELLLVMAVVLTVMALIARKHLNDALESDDKDSGIRAVETLKDPGPPSPKSLGYAIAKIASKRTRTASPFVPPPVRPNLFAGPPATPAAGANDQLSQDVTNDVKQIQANPDQGLFILEKGLAETSQPDAANYRLSLFQAALGITGDKGQIRDLAMTEMTSEVVSPPSDGSANDPSVETKRMIVSTAYKLYLNASGDAEQTLQDTQRVLNYQQDPSTKDLIVYDCLSRYPELKGRLGTN